MRREGEVRRKVKEGEESSFTPIIEHDVAAPLFQKRVKRMRELFADPEVRKEFFKGFKKRGAHREVLATGKEGVK